MRLHRFYIEPSSAKATAGKEKIEKGDLPVGRQVEIFDEAILHQMKNVFRLEKGDRVIFFDGGGKDVECVVEIISKKEGKFVVEKIKDVFIPEKKVTLYLSLIKKDNFELASRMATEIGISKIVPVLTERSEKKNIDLERLKRIVREASEQCGRGDVPEVESVLSLKFLVESLNSDSEIIVADFGELDLKSSKPKALSYKLFIGPEGGWADSEREFFKSKNVKFISLGPTVLRAETAATVASAFLIGE